MKSMIVILDSAAPSFCYYESALESESTKMSLSVFKQAVAYAQTNALTLNIVSGPEGLSRDQRIAIEVHGVSYLLYLPAAGCAQVEDENRQSCIPIVNASESASVEHIVPGAHLTAILRVAQRDLENLPEVWEQLSKRVYRIVLVVVGLEQFNLDSLAVYKKNLQIISENLEKAYIEDKELELNAISDRMALREPTHCSAGIDHVTVVQSGKLHICPGFAVRGEPSIGDLETGFEIPNGQLLERKRAPICSLCDAYHCRRCVHLNQLSTLEVNTPPWQLCRASHLEREASRLLLDKVHLKGVLGGLEPIQPIKYNDPLDAFLNPEKRIKTQIHTPSKSKKTVSDKYPMDISLEKKSQNKGQGTGPGKFTTSLLKKPIERRITPEERDTVRELHLRKVAIGSLFSSLLKTSRNELEQSPLYEDLVKDMGEASTKFQHWWETIEAKYGWKKEKDRKWRVDFESRALFLEESDDNKGD